VNLALEQICDILVLVNSLHPQTALYLRCVGGPLGMIIVGGGVLTGLAFSTSTLKIDTMCYFLEYSTLVSVCFTCSLAMSEDCLAFSFSSRPTVNTFIRGIL